MDLQPDLSRNVLHTVDGRRLTVRAFRLDELAAPTPRITLDVDREPYDDSPVWASLTAEEARQLAAQLLAEAAEVERDALGDHDIATIEVRSAGGDSYSLDVHGHQALIDQPVGVCGAGPTPVELFVAAFACSVASYAGGYLGCHGLERAGLKVVAEYEMAAARPARVAAVRVRVTTPRPLPAEHTPALRAVVSRCAVHNTLRHPPEVDIDIQ
jgi:uncharacterized OsmC-like protein